MKPLLRSPLIKQTSSSKKSPTGSSKAAVKGSSKAATKAAPAGSSKAAMKKPPSQKAKSQKAPAPRLSTAEQKKQEAKGKCIREVNEEIFKGCKDHKESCESWMKPCYTEDNMKSPYWDAQDPFKFLLNPPDRKSSEFKSYKKDRWISCVKGAVGRDQVLSQKFDRCKEGERQPSKGAGAQPAPLAHLKGLI